LPTYRIDVKIDPTQARAGARVVRGQLDTVKRSADRVGRAMRQAFAITGVGLVLAGMVRILANFEQQMSTVRAVTNTVGAEFNALREEALRLGISTRFSASQAAEGMVFLARAGFDASEVYAATAQVLTLAAAGGLDLARSADIASNVLQGFNIQAAESGRVVDVLALAANSSNTNVEQLGSAMSFVAPASASLGVSLEATAAAVSALSDAGIQATRAGTGLRQIFIQLEDAGGSLSVANNGLIPVLEELERRQLSLSEATDLVGVRQATALLVLLNSVDKIKELTEAYGNAEGAAQRYADIMNDNLNGALLAAKSAMEGLVIAMGDAGGTSLLTTAFQGLAAVLRFLAQNVDRVVDVIEALGVVLIINLARQAIPAAIVALRALGVAIITNPLGAIATIITIAVAAFVALADSINLTGDSAGTAFDFMAVLFGDLVKLLGDGINFVIGVFAGFGTTLDDFDFSSFVLGIARGIDIMVGVFEGAFNGILTYWRTFPMVWADIIIQGINVALTAVEGFLNSIIAALNTIPGVSIGTLDGIMPQIENSFEGAASNVGDAVAAGFASGLEKSLAVNAVQSILDRAEIRGAERAAVLAAQEGFTFATPEASTTNNAVRGGNSADPVAADRTAIINRELDTLAREADMLRVVGDERERLSARLEIEDSIRNALRQANSDLTEEQLNNLARLGPAEEASIDRAVQQNLELQRQSDILEGLRGEQQALAQQLEAITRLRDRELVSLEEYNRVIREIGVSQLQLRVENGTGTFADGFILQLEKMTNGVQTFVSGAGQAFGKFFSEMGSGFANSVGQAIVFSEDLGASLQNVARQALASLISGMVELGIQFLINNAIGTAIATAATGASVAQAAIVGAAWAGPAALVSLATGGTNAIGAAAGIASVTAMAELVAAAGGGLAGGGQVFGPGGPKGDRVLRALSEGEFVVNAQATANNLGLLREINAGRTPSPQATTGRSFGSAQATTYTGGSSVTVHAPVSVVMNPSGNAESDREMLAETKRTLARTVEPIVRKVIRDEQRNKGALSGKPGRISAP
jgi:TP901 family phage tail tape measure protein